MVCSGAIFLLSILFLFLLSVVFRDIYFLWSERKKELEFPMSESEASDVGSVVSGLRSSYSPNAFLPIVVSLSIYTLPDRSTLGKLGRTREGVKNMMTGCVLALLPAAIFLVFLQLDLRHPRRSRGTTSGCSCHIYILPDRSSSF